MATKNDPKKSPSGKILEIDAIKMREYMGVPHYFV